MKNQKGIAIKYGKATAHGPGIEIEFPGDYVVRAIWDALKKDGITIYGPRTTSVNTGELIRSGRIYVDPIGHIYSDGVGMSGRGPGGKIEHEKAEPIEEDYLTPDDSYPDKGFIESVVSVVRSSGGGVLSEDQVVDFLNHTAKYIDDLSLEITGLKFNIGSVKRKNADLEIESERWRGTRDLKRTTIELHKRISLLELDVESWKGIAEARLALLRLTDERLRIIEARLEEANSEES